MTDIMSKAERSKRMSLIKGTWTRMEKKVHGYLKANKIRHQMHPRIIGNPDVLLKDKKIVIFVHGCFWHKCPKHYREPKSNKKYWVAKIERNANRDRISRTKLRHSKYKIITIWEHDPIKNIYNILYKLAEGRDENRKILRPVQEKARP